MDELKSKGGHEYELFLRSRPKVFSALANLALFGSHKRVTGDLLLAGHIFLVEWKTFIFRTKLFDRVSSRIMTSCSSRLCVSASWSARTSSQSC
jgi:hypothetical protein